MPAKNKKKPNNPDYNYPDVERPYDSVYSFPSQRRKGLNELLSGNYRSSNIELPKETNTGPSKEVAKEFVEKTSEKKRKLFSKKEK